MSQQASAVPAALRRLWRRLRGSDREARARRRAAYRLYVTMVNEARTPALFRELGVPDTTEGRFELLGLHTALLVRRLRREGEAGRALGQEVFDLMFADVDVNLREIGIGDLSVGRYVKRLAGNYYARAVALDGALAGGGPGELVPMLRANVYHGGPPPTAAQVEALADHLFARAADLDAQPAPALLRGEIVLAGPRLHPAPGAPT